MSSAGLLLCPLCGLPMALRSRNRASSSLAAPQPSCCGEHSEACLELLSALSGVLGAWCSTPLQLSCACSMAGPAESFSPPFCAAAAASLPLQLVSSASWVLPMVPGDASGRHPRQSSLVRVSNPAGTAPVRRQLRVDLPGLVAVVQLPYWLPSAVLHQYEEITDKMYCFTCKDPLSEQLRRPILRAPRAHMQLLLQLMSELRMLKMLYAAPSSSQAVVAPTGEGRGGRWLCIG